jgi:Glucodextranase, domain B
VLLGALLVLAADNQRPSITIRTPTTASTYSTTTPGLTLGGTATDKKTGVVLVTCTTDRGVPCLVQGTAQWSATLTLPAGTTRLTVTAQDAAGNTDQDVLTVTLLGTPPPPGPVTVEWTYTGTQGSAFEMQRCLLSAPGCTIADPCGPLPAVAAMAIGDRQWIDLTCPPEEDCCYCLVELVGGVPGLRSQTLCTP